MNGYALVKGPRRKKVIGIGMLEDALLMLAWNIAGKSIAHAPIKVGNIHKKQLRDDGYDVVKIRFERVIQDGNALASNGELNAT